MANSPSHVHDPLVGHTLASKYLIQAFVREEALGKVYDAVQQPDHRLVSVKVLHPHLVENAEAFGRFGREMLATATVQHPNTIAMVDFGQHREVFHFLVLERFSARTLKEELSTTKGLPPGRVAHIAAQVASALSAAHQEHIFHRNLTSDNILLLNQAAGGDFVKIRDFGLSRLHNDDGDADDGGLTAAGARVGSAEHMAPEYILDGYVGPSLDLYALGILMFEMLTGKPPFTGHPGVVLDKHCDSPAPAPSSQVSGVPDWMDRLVLSLLEKDPRRRPATGGDVLAQLQHETNRRLGPPELLPEDPRPSTRAPEAPAPASSSSSKLVTVSIVVMVLVVLAALALGVVVALGVATR